MGDQLSQDLASLRLNRGGEGQAPAPPSLIRRLLPTGVVLALAGGAYLLIAPYVEARIFRPQVSVTEITVVSPAQSSILLTSAGYVIAEKKSKVAAKIDGRIAKLLVGEGDQVKAGDLLAELEASVEESGLAAAKARVATARARSAAAAAGLTEAKAQAERQRQLAERGAAPKATADDLLLRVKSQEESVRVADAEIVAAEAEVKSLSVNLSLMRVLAPIDGRVVNKLAEVGETVGPQAGPILELADFGSLIVETDVPEGRLYRAKVDAPTEIVLDAYPGKRYRGVVAEIVPRVNRAKGTVPVKVRFVDAPDGVLPDMAARVSFLEKALDAEAMKEAPKTIVPHSAITERDGRKVVFVLESEQITSKPIKLGPAFGPDFELVDGPAPGTKLIKDPQPTLFDGQRVKERNP